MLYKPENFHAKEKTACLKALVYILDLSDKQNNAKEQYFLLQLKNIGIAEEKYKEMKRPINIDTVITSLKALDNIRAQRFIIREMIMLVIAGCDIADEEIRHIYQIAEAIGVSGEKVGDFFIWAAKGIEWNIEGIQLIEEDL